MFSLEERGLNFWGIDSQVFRPMMHALTAEEGDAAEVFEVTFAKKAMSLRRRQGRVPLRPIPLARSAATTMANDRRDIVAGMEVKGGRDQQ